MSVHRQVATSELTGGDPALLNRIAWERRWSCRKTSQEYARSALESASKGVGERSTSGQGLARRTLAWQAKWRGDFDGSMSDCLAVESLLTEADFPRERADVYSIMGVIHYSRNRLDLANCAVDRGFYLLNSRELDEDIPTLIDLLTTRASIQRYSGEKARAGITLGRAFELAEGAETARVCHNIARWLLADEDYAKAHDHAEQALDAAVNFKNRVIMPYGYEVAGACQAAMDQTDRAAVYFKQGLEVAREDGDRRAQCQLIEQYARMELRLGHIAEARDLFDKGAKIARDMGYSLWQKIFALGLADVHEKLGNLQVALEQHKFAWRLQKNAR